MRILMVHPHDLGSTQEPWTVRPRYLAKEFVARGHDVRLVHFPLRYDVEFNRPVRHSHGYDLIPFSRARKATLRNIFQMMPHAKWADVVHFQKCYATAALPTLFAAYLKRKPIHYDWDDWEVQIYRYQPLSRLVGYYLLVMESMLPALVDTVSVSSDRLREVALGLGVPADRIFPGHVGADGERFRPDVDPGNILGRHGLRRPVVACMGQLHGAQYTELFLHAIGRILLRRRDVSFMVLGTGGRFGELYDLAHKLDILEHTVFTGPVSHQMMPKYLAAADVLVAPFVDNEQQRCKSPLKIAEYMAAGKAIVASRVGEVPTMIGDAGILVEPGDPVALSDGIMTLLDDPALRERLGQRARWRAESKYNWGVTAEHFLRGYHRAIEHFSSSSSAGFKRRVLELASTACNLEIDKNLDLMGVLDGSRAYTGQHTLQIDITNMCHNDCIACWCNSPLLGDAAMPLDLKRQTIPLDVMLRILDDARQLQVQEIYLSGGGDPTMHPDFLGIVEGIKERGLACTIHTSFTLVDSSLAERFADLGVEHLTVSMNAASPKMYALTHPNKPAETFLRIGEVLRHLSGYKNGGTPYIKLYNVISSVNYREVPEMVQHAQDVGADCVEFAIVDTIPTRTDGLLLDSSARKWLLQRCREIALETYYNSLGRQLVLHEFATFINRISHEGTLSGDHDRNIVESLPCYVGWAFSRVLADGKMIPCLKAHRMPVGNVHQESLRAIWNSPDQRSFRRTARVYEKKDPMFRLIGNDPEAEVGCYRGCDDLSRNQLMHQRMLQLTRFQRLMLRASSFFYRRRARPT